MEIPDYQATEALFVSTGSPIVSASGSDCDAKDAGFSATDYALLVGVHPITVYSWEQGKTKPRKEQLAALADVRKLGKREAHILLVVV